MKSIAIIPVLLLFFLSSCEKEKNSDIKATRTTTCPENNLSEYPIDRGMPDLCASDTCMDYLSIWEELIQERNNLSQDYMDNHIRVHSSGLNTWQSGTSFSVCYEIQIDWAITYKCDQFIININPDNTLYPHLDLPRDVNLTKEQIELALGSFAFSSSVAIVNPSTQVISLSLEDALNDLTTFAEVNTLCFSRITLNRFNGNLTLETFTEYENEENSCISAEMDLITGEQEAYDSPCFL